VIFKHFFCCLRQVKGCPLKINVTGVCDASKVLCTGDGLGIGTVGKDIRSFIDTRRAGPGIHMRFMIKY
jgi:filamin